MRFSCLKKNLWDAIGLVSGVAGKSVQLPILHNILLKVEQQHVVLTTTNLETAITVTMRARIEAEGVFTVPARTLSQCIGLLGDEKLTLYQEGGSLVIASDRSTTKLLGTPAEEFPVIPPSEGGVGFLVETALLKTALLNTLAAVARTDVRPELGGVFWGLNLGGAAGMVVAATDSYRLAEKKIPLRQGAEELRCIVPGRAAQEIVRIISADTETEKETDVRLLISENQLVVNHQNTQFISRLIVGQYPDYTQIIPREFASTVQVPTTQLQREVKAAGLFTTNGVQAVTLGINPTEQQLHISSASTQTGEYHATIAAEITGAAHEVVLNYQYLLDGLQQLGSTTAALKVVNRESPCVLRGAEDDSLLYIIMPIRQ